jgi:hypothetical protein
VGVADGGGARVAVALGASVGLGSGVVLGVGMLVAVAVGAVVIVATTGWLRAVGAPQAIRGNANSIVPQSNPTNRTADAGGRLPMGMLSYPQAAVRLP